MQADPLPEILAGLGNLQIEYASAQKTLLDAKSFLKLTDIRIAPFAKCFAVIQPTYLAMLLCQQALHSRRWWQDNVPSYDEKLIIDAILNYDQLHKLAFLHLMHFAIDSSLRTISRTLKRETANFATDPSENVYRPVLERLGLNKYRGVLCIIVLLRNATHNNGRHTEKTVTKHFKGKPYLFEQDKEPELYHWPRLFEIMLEIRNLFVDIANSDEFRQEYIEDPNAAYLKKAHEKYFQ